MDEQELTAAIRTQVYSSSGYIGGDITTDRARAMDRYLGNPIGNEIEGRSKVVSSDVQDVIEAVMPDLMQIFGASDKTVRFEPMGRGDEEFAEQATDYCNFVWNKDNAGFAIMHDWFKDALLQINGVIKIWWDEFEEETVEEYAGHSEMALTKLIGDDEVDVIEQAQRWAPEAIEMLKGLGIDVEDIDPEDVGEMVPPELLRVVPPEILSQAVVYDVKIRRTVKHGRVRIANVPPEEFLISRRAVSLDDAPFLAHWTHRTITDLIEDGYDEEQLKKIPSSEDNELSEERLTRFNRVDEWPMFNQDTDETEREIKVYECYIRVDYNEDGKSELRKVTCAGTGYQILKRDGELDNEEVNAHPFSSLTPIRMPHKFFGRSLAEVVEDIQLVKTSLLRQILDNAYNINNGRAAISDNVNLDDYLTNRVGSPIRVTGPAVSGQIEWQQTPAIGQHLYPAIEYMDTVRETRVGVNRLSQGIDPDALQSTASGMNMMMGRSQQRVLLIAQVMSLGVKDAFKKILKLITSHQDKARTIRLRDEWVDMDPRTWNSKMDVTVNVGLGKGTQEQQLGAVSQLMQIQEKTIMMQGGPKGPFVFPHHVSNTMEKWAEAAGLRTIEPYFAEIKKEDGEKLAEEMNQAPDPEVMKLEAETKAEAGKENFKAQVEMARDKQKAEVEGDKLIFEAQMREREIISKERTELMKIQLEHHREMLKMQQADVHDTARLEKEIAEHQDNLVLEDKKLEVSMMDSAEERRMKANGNNPPEL